MRLVAPSAPVLLLAALVAVAVFTGSGSGADRGMQAQAVASSGALVRLKDAKLNIEHNATDEDTGFQGFVDSEGWRRLDVRKPGGDRVLTLEGRGSLAKLGLTELFFESVEPENAEVPIDEMLAKLPEGNYTISGPTQENGRSAGVTRGTAWLTHDIPAGPRLVSPSENATVPTARLSRSLEARVQDDHGRAREDHRVPTHHREGRRASPAHDRHARVEHVPPALGDEHRRSERVPRGSHEVRLGSARNRAQREPDALVRFVPNAVRRRRRGGGSCAISARARRACGTSRRSRRVWRRRARGGRGVATTSSWPPRTAMSCPLRLAALAFGSGWSAVP